MRKFTVIFILLFIFLYSFGQTGKRTSTYIGFQYNTTLNDVTKGNNPWGAGIGFQTFLNITTNFRPTIELTGDTYLANDKVYRLNYDGTPKDDFRGMVNLFVGASFSPTQQIYLSFTGGPSFIGNQTLVGIKPSLGFYFSKSQKWSSKISYINIFNRDITTKRNFSSLSFAISLKVF